MLSALVDLTFWYLLTVRGVQGVEFLNWASTKYDMRKKGEHAIGSPDPNKKRADESTQKLNQTNSLEIMTRKWKKKHNGTEIKKKKRKLAEVVLIKQRMLIKKAHVRYYRKRLFLAAI